MYPLSNLAGSVVAGWFTPKGALKASIIHYAATAFSFIVQLQMIGARDKGLMIRTESSYLVAIAVSCGITALITRLRMRKFAGI
jgi:hypothetical protein